jgi:hypothetical protein
MNKKQRAEIQKYIDAISDAQEHLEELASEEQEKYDNMPESLQSSERGEVYESAASTLTNSAETLSDVVEKLMELIE